MGTIHGTHSNSEFPVFCIFWLGGIQPATVHAQGRQGYRWHPCTATAGPHALTRFIPLPTQQLQSIVLGVLCEQRQGFTLDSPSPGAVQIQWQLYLQHEEGSNIFTLSTNSKIFCTCLYSTPSSSGSQNTAK